ncbi:MAG: flippase-like domain-containing protein [Dehalococcoidia bacterium]|nr:flippase-like domain-containing protein [Dehalococcoidia bacterium]
MSRTFIGLTMTSLCVALLWRLIDWERTVTILRGAEPGWIALAVAALILSLVAKTVRWRLLLPDESGITTPRLYRILHISFLLNNVLPARLGDVARVAMTSRQPGLRFGHVLSSLLTERVTDFITLLACFVLVSPFLPFPRQYQEELRLAWIMLAGLALLTLVILALRHRLIGVAQRFPIPRRLQTTRLSNEAASFREGVRQLFSRRHILPIWGWSWTAWLGAFAINYLLMRALGINAPVTVAVLLTCTTNLAMLVPSSPGYLGVFHVAATLSLLPFNVGESTAFSFAVLAHLVNVLPVSIIGAVFLLLGKESLSLNVRALRLAPARAEVPLPREPGPDDFMPPAH